MSKLSDATDVVALLTPSSIDRPWILYEAGVAKGKLNTTVFGVALGIPLQKASVGPFAQFQNCAADEESLTKLVLQLIRRNPEASPREEAVGRQVLAFLKTVEERLKTRSEVATATTNEMDATTIAKLFEEVKVMFRDLPDKVNGRPPGRGRRGRTLHPMMLEEMFLRGGDGDTGPESNWLLIASRFRDGAPWFYELAMDLYRAYCTNDPEQVRAATQRMRSTIRLAHRQPFVFDPDDRDLYMIFRRIPAIFEQVLPRSEAPEEPKARSPKAKTKGKDEV